MTAETSQESTHVHNKFDNGRGWWDCPACYPKRETVIDRADREHPVEMQAARVVTAIDALVARALPAEKLGHLAIASLRELYGAVEAYLDHNGVTDDLLVITEVGDTLHAAVVHAARDLAAIDDYGMAPRG